MYTITLTDNQYTEVCKALQKHHRQLERQIAHLRFLEQCHTDAGDAFYAVESANWAPENKSLAIKS